LQQGSFLGNPGRVRPDFTLCLSGVGSRGDFFFMNEEMEWFSEA
jgi:hypothetical protein